MKKIKLDIQKFAGGSFEFSNGNMSVLLGWSSSVIGSNPTEKAINNKSRVSVALYVRRSDGYTTWGTFTGYANIDGNILGFSWDGTASSNWSNVYNVSIDVPHNSDGTRTCYIGGSVTGPTETSWEGRTATGGQNVSLDTIARMSNITSFTGIADLYDRTDNIEGNFKVDYTRYNPTFTDNLEIQYLDRADTGNYVTLKTIENYETGTSFSFTANDLNTLFESAIEDTTIKLKVFLKTYSGNSLIGTSNQVLLTTNIYDCDPLFNDFSFEDINPTTLALTGNSKYCIKGYSNIKATITSANKAIAQKGASISKYSFIIGTQQVDISYSSSSTVNGTINNASAGVFKVYAVDNRDRSKSIEKVATSFKDYSPLVRNTGFSATRDNNGVGGNVTLSFSGTIWNDSFGSVSNAFTSAKYYFKKTDSSTWIDLGSSMTNITPTISGNNYSFEGLIRSDNPDTTWDLESSYDIKVVLHDKLSTVEIVMVLASAKPTISLSRNGVGIMCDYDETIGGPLQIAGEPYAMGDTLPIDTVVEYEGSTVPTGFELVEDYSTDEIKTNQVWIDGKSIYRKVLHITSGIAVDTDKFVNISSLNIDNIVDLKGWTHQGGTGFGYISLYFNDGNGRGNKLHTQQGSSTLVYNHHWAADEIYIIIEYTKTTN